jgi:hypothetical protein
MERLNLIIADVSFILYILTPAIAGTVVCSALESIIKKVLNGGK